MRYTELSGLDTTPEQDKGLKIQFAQDTDTKAPTMGAYLVLHVLAVLDSFASRHVNTVIDGRVLDNYAKASPAVKQQVAVLLNVNTDPETAATAVAAEKGEPPAPGIVSRAMSWVTGS